MKTKEFRSLTKGDTVTHKKYGLCEVADFANWRGAPKDPVLMPLTQEGKELLLQHSGMKEAPFLETNRNLIEGSDKIEPSIESDIKNLSNTRLAKGRYIFGGLIAK
jgi:hypothetical protein